MPETGGGSTAGQQTSGSGDSAFVPTSLTSLIPTFDPAVDSVEVWAQKVELLSKVWPADKITELSTRLILNCKGSAFQKLQIRQKDLLKNDLACIKLLVEVVGGQFGQVPLERGTKQPRRHSSGAHSVRMSRMTRISLALMWLGLSCFLRIHLWRWQICRLT